jgi:hypothetical protein
MRTTINLNDDAYRTAHGYASARGITLGDAVSELVQRGIGQAKSTNIRVKRVHGISVFHVEPGPDFVPVTDEDVKRLMED